MQPITVPVLLTLAEIEELTLERLEELAIANNPVLAQATAKAVSAVGRQIQAGLPPNPTVSYVGTEIGNDGQAGQHGLVLSQEFVRGGKLQWSQAIAGFEVEQAEAESESQILRIRNAVRSLFYETLAAEQTLALTRELVTLAEEGVSVAQQREKAEEGTLTETLQSEVELQQVRILEANSANMYRATWRRLEALVAVLPSDPVPLAGRLDPPEQQYDERATLERVMAMSPEVRIAEAGIRRAEAALRRARAESIPNITVSAGTQYDDASKDQFASVELSLPIPIWNRNEGHILASEAELRRAHRELDRVRLSLADRYATAYARYRNAQEQVKRYGQRMPDSEVRRILSLMGAERQRELDRYPQILPRAQIALALTTQGWQGGEFSYLHVLTAQRTLTQVTLAYVRALAELLQSTAAIEGSLLSDGFGSISPSNANGE